MIDINIVLHRNYDLLDFQLKQWAWLEQPTSEQGIIQTGFHLNFCDNTPAAERKDLSSYKQAGVTFLEHDVTGIDGETHGSSLDLLMEHSTSPIVGICDSDFFWTKRNIVEDVEKYFEMGCKCVGVELWYDDFDKVNKMYPERAGHLAPCVFGMFVDRELALSETFVVTAEEGRQYKETGWRLRQKIINEQIPCCVFRTRHVEGQPDPKVVFYGQPILGVHLLKGSNAGAERAIKLFDTLGLKNLYTI